MPKQPLIVGNPVLVVVDMQESGDMPVEEVGIPHMAGYADRIAKARRLIAAARAAAIPIVVVEGTAEAGFPYEIAPPIRRFAELSNNIVHWSEFDRGGHFAAMEEPDLLVADVRAFFRPLR